MRVSIIDALFTTVDNKRSRRHNSNNNSIDTSIQLLKAVEQEIKTYEMLCQTTSNRKRRSNNDLKAIMEEFQTTRDAIKMNYDWKHFNFDEFNETAWNSTVPIPVGDYNNDTICPPRDCNNNCKLEILFTSLIFGALIITTYAFLKIFNYHKKNQK